MCLDSVADKRSAKFEKRAKIYSPMSCYVLIGKCSVSVCYLEFFGVYNYIERKSFLEIFLLNSHFFGRTTN